MTPPTVATIRVFGREIPEVRGVAVAAGAVAALMLLGWGAGIDILTRGAPNLPRTMPLTAILIGLSALALERCASVPSSRLGSAAAVLVAIGSAAASLLYVTGVPASVLPALTMAPGVGAQLPGVPAANTALAMLAIALAIIWLDRAPVRRVYPAEVASGTAATIAVTALVGQAYGATYLYGVSAHTGMSLPSALCILALSIGVFAARTDRGLAAALRSDRLGLTVTNRLVPLVIGVPTLFGWLVSTGHQAGYFDMPLGSALQTVATILVGLFAVGRTAVVIDRLDAERRRMNDERQAALADAANEARFRSIFENTAVALVEHDVHGLATRLSELREPDCGSNATAVTPDRDLIEWMLGAAPPVDANPAALALFGASSKEALGASWRDLLLPQTFDVFARAVGAFAAGHEKFEAEAPIRTLSGARRDLVISIVFPPPPAVGRVLVSLVDVTERKRAQQTVLDAQRAREAAAHAATEQERQRVGRGLHDGALQELAALKLMLEAEWRQHAGDAVERALRRTGDIIQEVRAVVEDLRPPELARGSLPEAISTRARVLTAQGSVALICEVQPTVRLPDWVALHVYRIAQEAIGNAVRHGRPRQLAVRLWQGRFETCLEVEDDGVGFDSHALHDGSGLANMRERALSIAADLSIESRANGGTRVRLLMRADAWSESAPGPQKGLSPAT